MSAPLSGIRLILASASPRRIQLLQGLDIPVEVTRVDIDETPPQGTPAADVAELIARKKSEAWTGTLASDQILITADTTVVLDDVVIGKPGGLEDAKAMLRQLSGRTHIVWTGVCLRSAKKMRSFCDRTSVTFKPLTEDEITHYVERYRPIDKAGAYGVQEYIGYIGVVRLEGSFYNVMGLPMHRLYAELSAFRASSPDQGHVA